MTVLDIVDDLGADRTGAEPINEHLAEAIDSHDNVEVRFPEGEYAIRTGNDRHGFARGDPRDGSDDNRLGSVALVGEGAPILRPARERPEGHHDLLTLWGHDLRIEHFVLDQMFPGSSIGVTAVAERTLKLEDIHVAGQATADGDEPSGPEDGSATAEPSARDAPPCLTVGLLEEDGVGTVERILAPDGAAAYSRKTGAHVIPRHAGDLLFTECEFSRFSDAALDGAAPGRIEGHQGSVRVENSLFRNNNVAAIRLGTAGSYARNCAVLSESGEIPPLPWGEITSRAAWIGYGFHGTVGDVDVVHFHPAGQGICARPDGMEAFRLAVEDCRFELHNDRARAIDVAAPGVGRLDIEDVEVIGTARGGAAMTFDDCILDMRRVRIAQTGPDRTGVDLTAVTGSIEDSTIDVTGTPVAVDGDSDIIIDGLDDEGTCEPIQE